MHLARLCNFMNLSAAAPRGCRDAVPSGKRAAQLQRAGHPYHLTKPAQPSQSEGYNWSDRVKHNVRLCGQGNVGTSAAASCGLLLRRWYRCRRWLLLLLLLLVLPFFLAVAAEVNLVRLRIWRHCIQEQLRHLIIAPALQQHYLGYPPILTVYQGCQQLALVVPNGRRLPRLPPPDCCCPCCCCRRRCCC